LDCDLRLLGPLPLLPMSPAFPYTTLFRSACHRTGDPGPCPAVRADFPRRAVERVLPSGVGDGIAGLGRSVRSRRTQCRRPARPRSEEHTSELQSRENLVCRLLLEIKNKHG